MSQYRFISICQRTISIISRTQEGTPLISKNGAVKKKCVFVSTSRPQEQNGFRVSWKLCLNFCSCKWFTLSLVRRSLVRYLIPLQLWKLNTLFVDGLINVNKLFLKTLRPAALRRLGSNLFHSIAVDGKREFLKKLCFVWNGVILFVFLIL